MRDAEGAGLERNYLGVRKRAAACERAFMTANQSNGNMQSEVPQILHQLRQLQSVHVERVAGDSAWREGLTLLFIDNMRC